MRELDWSASITELREVAKRAAAAEARIWLAEVGLEPVEEPVRVKDLVSGEVRTTTEQSATKAAATDKIPPGPLSEAPTMRTFWSGATRSTDAGKPDYEGYLSPLVIRRYGEYMTANRVQADGKVRTSDNWTKGIPTSEYLKSLLRHVVDVWLIHRQYPDKATGTLQDALCGVMFNAMGYLFEEIKREQNTTAEIGR